MFVAEGSPTPRATRFYVVVAVTTVASRITLDLCTSSEVVDERDDCPLDYRVINYESIFLMTGPAEILVPAM